MALGQEWRPNRVVKSLQEEELGVEVG